MSGRGGLGRIHVPDARDANYPMRAVIDQARRTTAANPRTHRTWTPRSRPVLDQGQTPECVSHAFTHWYNDGPVVHSTPLALTPDALYHKAQTIDGDPSPHDGTTGRAAAQVLRGLGVITSFHNAQTFQDVIDCLLYVGPVCVGTAWHEDMFTPDRFTSFLSVTGPVAGGHEYVLDAIDVKAGWIEMKNSWGPKWGRRGFARFHLADLEQLWADQGDAIVAVEAP